MDAHTCMSCCGRDYRIIRLLGHGKGGYSYLVADGSELLVLKQIHHEPCSYYQFGDKMQSELNDYRKLKEIGIPMPVLLQADLEPERILKQYIPGPTAFELVLKDQMKPDYLRQVRGMCAKLYDAGLNIDYYPTNFIIQDDRLWYIDFECNAYQEQWDFEHWGVRYWSRTSEFLAAAEAGKE